MRLLHTPFFRFISIGAVLGIFAILGTPRQTTINTINAQRSTSPTAVASTPTVTATETVSPVSTATAIVTKLEDTDDGHCDPDDCSLREAVSSLTSGGKVTFADNVEGVIYLEDQIQITSEIEIIGKPPKSDRVILQAKYGRTIIRVQPKAKLAISLLTIAGSPDFQNSGGIYIDSGTLIVVDCTFRDNGLSAITNLWGFIDISGSSFYRNEATKGGAIENFKGSAHIRNSTFYGNKATTGGAIANVGTMTIQFSTFSHNKATSSNIIDNQKELSIGNSILDGPMDSRRFTTNCEGNPYLETAKPFLDAGHNIQYPNDHCGTTVPVRDPKLSSTLADNGGPTETIALLDASPAIDAGDAWSCSSIVNLLDQRGIPRPSDKCDIGAYERE